MDMNMNMNTNTNMNMGMNLESAKVNAAEDRAALLKKVQSYCFAAFDMLLYLDTHPDDKKAFDMFKNLVMRCKELTKQFEDRFGPLTHASAANFDTFRWIDGPWPWEKEANK